MPHSLTRQWCVDIYYQNKYVVQVFTHTCPTRAAAEYLRDLWAVTNSTALYPAPQEEK